MLSQYERNGLTKKFEDLRWKKKNFHDEFKKNILLDHIKETKGLSIISVFPKGEEKLLWFTKMGSKTVCVLVDMCLHNHNENMIPQYKIKHILDNVDVNLHDTCILVTKSNAHSYAVFTMQFLYMYDGKDVSHLHYYAQLDMIQRLSILLNGEDMDSHIQKISAKPNGYVCCMPETFFFDKHDKESEKIEKQIKDIISTTNQQNGIDILHIQIEHVKECWVTTDEMEMPDVYYLSESSHVQNTKGVVCASIPNLVISKMMNERVGNEKITFLLDQTFNTWIPIDVEL